MTNSENWHFSKGVNSCFWSKNGLLSNLFFLGNIGQKNVFYNILEQKNGFVGYKNMKFKKSKIDIFRKGISHAFGPKMPFFSILIFRRYRQGKCLWRYSRTKKRLSRLQKKFKKSEISHFFKGVDPSFCSKNGHFSKFIFLDNMG